jgi:hypothetical protein
MRRLDLEERHRRRLHQESGAFLCSPFLPSFRSITCTTMPYYMGIQSSVIVPPRGA